MDTMKFGKTETRDSASGESPSPSEAADRAGERTGFPSSASAGSPVAGSGPDSSANPPSLSASDADLEKKIVEVLRTCYDPEIPVNIYELGLIYKVDIQPGGVVAVRMTLTSPMCPVAGSLPPEVEAKVRNVPGVASATVEVVWDPPWTPDMMSPAAKLQLNMM
jgi:FeS assembly SUF system protein